MAFLPQVSGGVACEACPASHSPEWPSGGLHVYFLQCTHCGVQLAVIDLLVPFVDSLMSGTCYGPSTQHF